MKEEKKAKAGGKAKARGGKENKDVTTVHTEDVSASKMCYVFYRD